MSKRRRFGGFRVSKRDIREAKKAKKDKEVQLP